MLARFRDFYGASPLHLIAFAASLLIAGAAIAGLFDSFQGPIVVKILEWFVGAVLAHDLVLLPLYSLLDRIAFGVGAKAGGGAGTSGVRRPEVPPDRVAGLVYVRVPALLSGLLFLVFFPEILRFGDTTFFTASGFHQRVFLVRYLLTCGALFVLSGVAYAATLARERRRSAGTPGAGQPNDE